MLIVYLSFQSDVFGEEYSFIFQKKLIKLKISDSSFSDKLEKHELIKMSGQDFLVYGKIDCFGHPLIMGRNVKEGENGVFYMEGSDVRKLISMSYGQLVEYNKKCYVFYVDYSMAHTPVSWLYMLGFANNKITSVLVYKLPGVMENFSTEYENLILYGGVNNRPFALSIDDDGNWEELRNLNDD